MDEVKKLFSDDLYEVVRGIPHTKKLFIGGDFNGYIRCTPMDYNDVYGHFGFSDRNAEGVSLLNFARDFGLVVANLRFSKKKEHLVTFRSTMAKTEIDYLLLRKDDKGLCKDCKVIPSGNLMISHKLLVMD